MVRIHRGERLSYHGGVRVWIRHQRKEVELHGVRRVRDLLQELGLNPETVIVIRGGDLLTQDAEVREDDEIEIRPVVSGGIGALHEV